MSNHFPNPVHRESFELCSELFDLAHSLGAYVTLEAAPHFMDEISFSLVKEQFEKGESHSHESPIH
jgi:hypothetical protein